MKRKTNKAKEEAWSQTAHAPDGEQPGPEASDTSGQSILPGQERLVVRTELAVAVIIVNRPFHTVPCADKHVLRMCKHRIY